MNFSDSELDAFFERKYAFHREDDWDLPSIDLLHKDDLWELKSFIQMKIDLNNSKSLLNDKGEDWQEHTSRINKASCVIGTLKRKIHTELLTQAWCKFYEILCSYKVFPEDEHKYKSLHLCEAPGAFISALNHYLYANHLNFSWEWYANTLNPYYEGQNVKNVIVDDRLLLPTLEHWCFGQDNTGDITDPSYLKDIDSLLDKSGKFNLVTADGSINCIEDPGEQETLVAELHFSEMLVALKSLAHGGTFVLKKFTFFECVTICKMYFLNCVFEEVHVFKPFTSKAGNSEVYVICKGYKGIKELAKYLESLNLTYVSKRNKSLFPLSSIPQSFIVQLQNCCKTFMDLQTQAILENLKIYSSGVSNYQCQLEQIQKLCTQKFLERYNVVGTRFQKLYQPGTRVVTSFHNKNNLKCKTMYFQALGETYENLTKLKTVSWLELLLDLEKRLTACFLKIRKRPHHHTERRRCVWNQTLNERGDQDYSKWITTGKKIHQIQNSKFCNPFLLHLWTRISYEAQVKFENHASRTHCCWDMEDLLTVLAEKKEVEDLNFVSLSRIEDGKLGEDPLFVELKQTFHKSYVKEYTFTDIENCDVILPAEKRIIYIDTTYWVKSLNPELEIRRDLVKSLSIVTKFFQEGDTLLLCLQSSLTRFTVGILYMVHTLYEKFECIQPIDLTPAVCSQLWVFHNFKRPAFTNKFVEHLEAIQSIKVPEMHEVLETVPIHSLCGPYFYEYLLEENNKHLIKRLQSLISTEKLLYKNSFPTSN